jgi:hypothetical protein
MIYPFPVNRAVSVIFAAVCTYMSWTDVPGNWIRYQCWWYLLHLTPLDCHLFGVPNGQMLTHRKYHGIKCNSIMSYDISIVSNIQVRIEQFQGIIATFKLREMIMDRVHLEVLHIHFSGFLLILKTRLLILEWVCQRVTSVRSSVLIVCQR